jgi:hypothetical protein
MASGHVNRTNRPNTWLHRPSLQREDFPCQLGAVDGHFPNGQFDPPRTLADQLHDVPEATPRPSRSAIVSLLRCLGLET